MYTVKNIMVGKVSTQCVVAARRSQEARNTFSLLHRPEILLGHSHRLLHNVWRQPDGARRCNSYLPTIIT